MVSIAARSREREPARDGLQRHFHGEIEMRGKQRLYMFDDLAAITLECVRDVIERQPEEHLDEPVCKPVDHPLVHRIAYDFRAAEIDRLC